MRQFFKFSINRRKLLPALALTIGVVLALAACGVKGSPKAPTAKNTFSWLYADAAIRNDCISVTGRLQGEYDNLDSLRFELEPTGNIEDCVGCPFRPLEMEVIYASDINMSPDGEISLLYCPEQKSHLYRWRLIATNRFPTLPNAVTPVLTLEDPAGPLPWN